MAATCWMATQSSNCHKTQHQLWWVHHNEWRPIHSLTAVISWQCYYRLHHFHSLLHRRTNLLYGAWQLITTNISVGCWSTKWYNDTHYKATVTPPAVKSVNDNKRLKVLLLCTHDNSSSRPLMTWAVILAEIQHSIDAMIWRQRPHSYHFFRCLQHIRSLGLETYFWTYRSRLSHGH